MQRRVNLLMTVDVDPMLCYPWKLRLSAPCCRALELLQILTPVKQVQDLKVLGRSLLR